MKLQSADDIIINRPNHKQRTNKLLRRAPPTSVQIIKQVTVGSCPLAVCQHNGYTYVGREYRAVDRIDEGGNVTSSFIKLAETVTGIVAYEDRLYTLMYGGRDKPYTVHVHDLSGQQLFSWKYEDMSDFLGRFLTVIHNKLVIADRTNKRFTIYTLTGEFVRDVPCDLINDAVLTICHVGDNSILVAICGAKPGLYRMNLTTGDVEWRSDSVYSPVGILMYRTDYALFTSYSSSNRVKIFTLNADTGRKFYC